MEKFTSIQVQLFLRVGAELGAIAALIHTGKIKPYLKKTEAFNIYGRKYVERWIEIGLLTPVKDGGRSAHWRLDRWECETLSKAHFLSAKK